MPELRASLPIMAPPWKASSGFHVAVVARLEGRAVRRNLTLAAPWVATPSPASASHCGGMPRRGMPGITPAWPWRASEGAFQCLAAWSTP